MSGRRRGKDRILRYALATLREGSWEEKVEVLKEIYYRENLDISTELFDDLLNLLLYEDSSPEVICWSAAILSKNYEKVDKNFLTPLTYILFKNLDNPDPYVRATMLLTLANILRNSLPPIVISYLGKIVSMLVDSSVLVRTFAFDTLSEMIEILPEDVVKYIIPEVVKSLETEHHTVSVCGIYLTWKILLKYPYFGEVLIPKLLTLLYSSPEDVRVMIGLVMTNVLSRNN